MLRFPTKCRNVFSYIIIGVKVISSRPGRRGSPDATQERVLFGPVSHWPQAAVRLLLVVPSAPLARITGYGCIQAEHRDLFHPRRGMSDELSQAATSAAEATVTLFRPVG